MIDVSVVTPAYNASSTIERLLDALSGQTFAKDRFEVVIVDDGSTDSTQNIIERYSERHNLNIRLVRGNHSGRGKARNKGIDAAKGKVVAFTDADCIPDNDWVENCYNEVVTKKHPLVSGLTYCLEESIHPWKVSPAGKHWITANMAMERIFIGDVRFRMTNCEETDFILQIDGSHPGKIRFTSNKMKVQHPVNRFSLKGVIRYARRRRQEVLLVKHHGKKAYSSMHPIYRPILLGRFSLLFLTFCMFAASVLALGLSGLLIDIILAFAGGIVFVLFGYRIVVEGRDASRIGFKDRTKTFLYFMLYNVVYFISRVEGSMKYRKVVL